MGRKEGVGWCQGHAGGFGVGYASLQLRAKEGPHLILSPCTLLSGAGRGLCSEEETAGRRNEGKKEGRLEGREDEPGEASSA